MALLVGGLAAVVAGAGLLTVMIGTGIMTIRNWMSYDALAILMDIGLDQCRSTYCAEVVSEDYRLFNRVLYRKRKEAVK